MNAEQALERAGGTLPYNRKISCPYHGPERTPSLHIYENNFYCFGCGQWGDGYELYSKLTGIPLGDVLRDFKDNRSSAHYTENGRASAKAWSWLIATEVWGWATRQIEEVVGHIKGIADSEFQYLDDLRLDFDLWQQDHPDASPYEVEKAIKQVVRNIELALAETWDRLSGVALSTPTPFQEWVKAKSREVQR